MSRVTNSDSNKGEEYQESFDSGPSCKRNNRQRDSTHKSFKKNAADKSVSDFKRDFFKLLENAAQEFTDTQADTSSQYFVPGVILATDSNTQDNSYDETMDLNFGKGHHKSSKHEMSNFKFPSDVHDISHKENFKRSLGNSRSSSSQYYVPGVILATDSNVQGVSSFEIIDSNLENGRRTSKIHEMSDFKFPSDVHDVSHKGNLKRSLGNSHSSSSQYYVPGVMLATDSNVQGVSSFENMDINLENGRCTSKHHEMSDFKFPSDFRIHDISPKGHKRCILDNSRSISGKYDESDYSFPSEFQVRLAIQDEYEDSELSNFPHSYDLSEDSNDDGMDMKFPKYAPESKTNFKKLSSPMRAWTRVLQKYSPATEIFHSPIKPIEANVKPNVTNDELILAQVWIVGMSEQFYYDNSITLIHKYNDVPADLHHALTINSRFINTEEILDTFVDVAVLGSGSFGDVYRVRKADTKEYMAVKFLKTDSIDELTEHTGVLLEYLKEKNYLIKARNSPFVVQFINSFKFPGINRLFLFFEWCLCDLRKYLKLFVFGTDALKVTKSLWDGVIGGINDLKTKTFSAVSMDFLTVAIIYIFEVFCAMDFLAKCNVVHQDLKPDNVMISTNFHLKIVDFGLAYNTSFVTRRTQLQLIDANKINLVESSNYKPVWGGTYLYQDLELCYRSLRNSGELYVNQIINDEDHVDVELSTNDKDDDPDFMSDLWACGIIATELIFGGVHIFRPESIPCSMKFESNASWVYSQNVMVFTYLKSNYVRYIEKGFSNYGAPAYEDLMTFLGSIFKPRQERAKDFVKEKEVYRYKNKVRLKHIDIKKVEKISVFADMGLTSNNVFLYSMPEKLNELLNKPFVSTHKTLRDLLATIPNDDQNDFIDLKPGLQSNYF